jgi:hypothetical protein
MKYIAFALLFSYAAHAQTPERELNDQVQTITQILERESSDREIELQLVRVRTVLELGVEVPGITNLSVNPEVELYFTK